MAVDTDEHIVFEEDHKCCNTGIGNRLLTCMPLNQDLAEMAEYKKGFKMCLSLYVLQNLIFSDVKFQIFIVEN